MNLIGQECGLTNRKTQVQRCFNSGATENADDRTNRMEIGIQHMAENRRAECCRDCTERESAGKKRKTRNAPIQVLRRIRMRGY